MYEDWDDGDGEEKEDWKGDDWRLSLTFEAMCESWKLKEK